MNPNFNSGENLTELVFENKNKAYGAYALRVSQGENVTYSVMTTAILFMALALLSFWIVNRTPAEIIDFGPNDPGVLIRTIVTTPPEDKKIIEPQKIEKPASAPKTDPSQAVVTNSKPDTNLKPNDNQNSSPNPNPKADTTGTGTNPDPNGKGPETITVKKPEIEKAEKFVDKMPYMDNMEKFIRDNLKFPRAAIDNGTEGIVVLTFVVEKDGSITDIQILNPIGDGCEQEAKRVVSIMPAWHPGILKGEIKRTQCNLPIRFRVK